MFRAARWLDSISRNIELVPANARIVLSDEVSSDDSVEQLAGRFRNDPRIRPRLRRGEAGWWQHCNALIAECETELFSILPQDDRITPGYYEALVAALDDNPGAGIAFGRLFTERNGIESGVLPAIPFRTGTFEPWLEAIALEGLWHPGIAFRGVVRRTALLPMPQPTAAEPAADELWIFSMALATHLLEVPAARYIKRVYPTSTSADWTLSEAERTKRLAGIIRDVLGPGETSMRALRFLELTGKFGNKVYASRSWKVTAPLRRLAEMLRKYKKWLLKTPRRSR
jgi:hypothetical protein